MDTRNTRDVPVSSYEFAKKIGAAGVANLGRCYQCSMCSDGCPVAYAMDYYPHQLIHMVRLGLKELLLRSRAIWLCTSCETCATRCPNEIDIIHLMDVLRQESIKEGFKSTVDEIPRFHNVFMDEIRRKGRLNEVGLILRYKLRTRDFLSLKKTRDDAVLGLKMLFRGKLKIRMQKVHRWKEIKKIFKHVMRP